MMCWTCELTLPVSRLLRDETLSSPGPSFFAVPACLARKQGIKTVMMARLDLAVTKGCDGVEPDAIEVLSRFFFILSCFSTRATVVRGT